MLSNAGGSADTLTAVVARAIARGEVSLWLGEDWSLPVDASEQELLSGTPWQAVWSVSTDSALADLLQDVPQPGRTVVEVTDDLTEVLGPHVQLARFLPYLYMNGKDAGWVNLRQGRRQGFLTDRRRVLQLLKKSVLIVAGYSDGRVLAELLTNEILEFAPDLRVFVTGLPVSEWQALAAHLPLEFQDRVRVDEKPLIALLSAAKRVSEAWSAPEVEDEILIGSHRIPLRALLSTTSPPVDQEFEIVRFADTQPPRPEEQRTAYLSELLRGRRTTWRAFAHDVQWHRDNRYKEIVLERLRALDSRDGDGVIHIELPAESGSGISTLLQELAFESARQGFPALLHKTDHATITYDILRTFLTELRQAEQKPVTLLFDRNVTDSDTANDIYEIRERLRRDGIRALLICAVDTDVPAPPHVKRFKNPERPFADPLTAVLSDAQRESLLEWAQRSFESITAEQIQTIRRWNEEHSEAEAPLLVWLYSVLHDDLRSAAELGRHIAERLERCISGYGVRDAQPSSSSGGNPLSQHELSEAIAALKQAWGSLATKRRPPASLFVDVIGVLAASGSLRISVPRSVLRDITGAGAYLDSVLVALERTNFITLRSDEYLELDRSIEIPNRVGLAPSAFYTLPSLVSLRHAGYGRLLLEFEASHPEGISHGDLSSEIITAAKEEIDSSNSSGLPDYPLRLLRPIFSRLRPLPDHIAFAEQVSVQYLRLQREYGTTRSKLAAWQWENPGRLSEAFGWLKRELMDQSDVLLHGRGMKYKRMSTGDLPTMRAAYAESERDFTEAAHIGQTAAAKEYFLNPLTSLGLLYVGWAKAERENHGDRLAEIEAKAQDTLRNCLTGRQHNPFAAYGLAKFNIESCEGASRTDDGKYVHRLTEAIELLQGAPNAGFATEWYDMLGRAVVLLESTRARRVIGQLKNDGDRLGYALEALLKLRGDLPTLGESAHSDEILTEILHDLDDARAKFPDSVCHLADLIAYASFSGLSTRDSDPAFIERYERLNPLRDTYYGRQSIWLYDLGLLSMQTGRFQESEKIFDELRRGRRFFDVPQERSSLLAARPDSSRPRVVRLKITALDVTSTRGWGRIDLFREPVPFETRDFKARGWTAMHVGGILSGYVRIRPSGPMLIPEFGKSAVKPLASERASIRDSQARA